MEMKKTYYIAIASGEISQSATSSPWDFKIEASQNEIQELRLYFDKIDSTGWKNFFRAHIPFLEYHHDKENDEYDEILIQIYNKVYQLGDQEARNTIEEMGILN